VGETALDLRCGVKIYDNDWFLRHKMSAEQTADFLADWGVTYVIAQSKFLPMSNSAVTSSVSDEDRRAYDALDDRHFRDLLGERGIAYSAVLNVCFDPAFAVAHPELAAIDQWGKPIEMQDWYIGIPPDREENLAHKIGLLEKAVVGLQPDAIHLGFIRWPGFWETWLDGDRRADKPEYCFSARTLDRFVADTGTDVATRDPVAAARNIQGNYRQAWTEWKCRQTVKAIGKIREALARHKRGLEYSINTVPFFQADFDNAVEEVFGQNIAMLGSVVDIFEVMAYHQILAKPPTWPAAVAADIKGRSGRQAICTLQARALYLEDMHAGKGRQSDISAEDFGVALDALAASPVDGACVFTLTDLLDIRETEKGRAMIDSLRNFRRG
jgi:hypothetical protein